MDLPPVQDLRHFVIGKSWLCFFVVEREPRPAESGQQGEGAEEECVCSHWDNKRRLPLVALRFIICSSSSARDPAPLTGRHRGQSAASRVDRCASQSPPLLAAPSLLSPYSLLCHPPSAASHFAHPPASIPALSVFFPLFHAHMAAGTPQRLSSFFISSKTFRHTYATNKQTNK